MQVQAVFRTAVQKSPRNDVVAEGRPLARVAAPLRLQSLDVFRGLTIAAMILVNNPGSFRHVYPILNHAVWNGARPADLIFPFFLFIVGVSVSLSFAQHGDRGTRQGALLAIVARRTLLLFALGALINGVPYFDWDVFRISGVLQRIALCYGAAAVCALTLPVAAQVGVTIGALASYWLVMMLIPVPGFGAGNLTPDGNLAAYIDRTLMGGHLLHEDWDPEGLLSTIPAAATTMLGVLAGRWLRAPQSSQQRLLRLLIGGATAVVVGEIMSLWFPLNKSLWSSSYAVYTAGVAMISLGACYWLVDIEGIRRWSTPFVIYGTNPIIAYFGSSLVAKALELMLVRAPDGANMPVKRFIYEELFLRVGDPAMASLLYALVTVGVWLGVTSILYRRGIFVKV